MGENEWLECTDSQRMLIFFGGRVSQRKLRLFACACCRDIWHLIPSKAARRAVEASEDYANGRIRRKDLLQVREQARRQGTGLSQRAVLAASRGSGISATWVARLAAEAKERAGKRRSHSCGSTASPNQCHWLRDIIGPLPFRRIFTDPEWFNRGIAILPMARRIYQDRAFDQLPILADALEESGCDHPDILEHCREPGPHVLGCWVLDLLLRRECLTGIFSMQQEIDVYEFARELKVPSAVILDIAARLGLEVQDKYTRLDRNQQVLIEREWRRMVRAEGKYPQEYVKSLMTEEARSYVRRREPVPKAWLRKRITVEEAQQQSYKLDDLGPDPVPFGYSYGKWGVMKEMMKAGDELWIFSSPSESWANLAGRAGIALVRKGRVIASMVNLLN